MSIIVTQGHEKGIGLEVFLKSCLFQTQKNLDHILLVTFKASLEATLDSLQYPYAIEKNRLKISDLFINCHFLKSKHFSESLTSLEESLNIINANKDILLTLPTSKDQFVKSSGHTEFLRQHYQKDDLTMFFSSPYLNVLLLTDHVPVCHLSSILTKDFIFSKLKTSLETLMNWQWPLEQILISGLNPHCGENGLIGDEDHRIIEAKKKIHSFFKKKIKGPKNFIIKGPFSGDSLIFEKKSKNDLLIYLFHDQGLGVFKSLEGFIGSNITLGLPYPRLSPDHGTSFTLFGKNQADFRGCEYTLNLAIKLNNRYVT